MRRVDSLEKTLMLVGVGGRRRRGWQRMRWLDGITDSMDVSLSEVQEFGDGQGSLACCNSWGRKESDTTERLNWTEPVCWAVTRWHCMKWWHIFSPYSSFLNTSILFVFWYLDEGSVDEKIHNLRQYFYLEKWVADVCCVLFITISVSCFPSFWCFISVS